MTIHWDLIAYWSANPEHIMGQSLAVLFVIGMYVWAVLFWCALEDATSINFSK